MRDRPRSKRPIEFAPYNDSSAEDRQTEQRKTNNDHELVYLLVTVFRFSFIVH